MGVQTDQYKPRDHQEVNHLQAENATSGRRRADVRSADIRINSTEPWLDANVDSLSAIMAEWPWEPTDTPPMQQSSPMLQSSSSQSSHEQQPPRTQDASSMQPPGISTSSIRTSLVETLQTCLNSNPSSSPVSTTTRSVQLGPAKPLKRRSRASRRVPTMVLESTSSDFRDMVQRLTGLTSAQSTASAAPVRPMPQRAAPVTTFIRPDRPAMNSSILNFSGNSQVISSNNIHQNFSMQLFAPNIKREFDGGSSTFATSSPIVAAVSASLPSWWESGPSNSSSEIPNEIVPIVDHVSTATTSEPGSSIVLPDGSELSMTQFDAWLSGQDDT